MTFLRDIVWCPLLDGKKGADVRKELNSSCPRMIKESETKLMWPSRSTDCQWQQLTVGHRGRAILVGQGIGDYWNGLSEAWEDVLRLTSLDVNKEF